MARLSVQRTTKTTPKKGQKTKSAVTRATDWPTRFIAELAKRGIVQDAARAAKINRVTAYQKRKSDPEFAAQWDDALETAADAMEAEAFRRAVKGVIEPVFYKGSEVGHIRRYSDTLLIFLLKGVRPEKFRERYEQSGKIKIVSWKDEVIEYLRSGKVTADDVYAELGDADEIKQLVVAAGALQAGPGAAEGQGDGGEATPAT